MDAFEQKMYQRKRWQVRFFLMLPILVALLLGAATYVFIYHVNQFSMELNLHGSDQMTLDYGDSFIDPGAVAVFSGTHLFTDGLEIPVRVEGHVDVNHIGTYQLRYFAEHLRWQAEVIRTVTIVDDVAPRIWLVETPGSYVIPGQTYQEEGFLARDNYDGDLTDQVVKAVLSDRIIYYVEDSSGNRDEVVRSIVYYDPIPPELTLKGDSSITITEGGGFEEPGYTATDNCDGDITHRVQITGSVNTKKSGTYKLIYTVEDSFGHVVTAERTVKVKEKPKVQTSTQSSSQGSVQSKPKPHQSEVVPSGKVIYLTFDDGPSQHTERLLEILKKYNVKATFFVMKTSYSNLIDDIVAQGHAIGAHTYTHTYENVYASEEAYFADLDRILNLIESKTGVSTKLIRFPGGSSNTVSRINPGIMSRLTYEVVNRGYRYFDWNVSSGDAGGAKTAEKVYENVISGIGSRKTAIVLQHDTKGYSVDAVEKIILWGLENGYTFLPLNQTSPTAAHSLNN